MNEFLIMVLSILGWEIGRVISQFVRKWKLKRSGKYREIVTTNGVTITVQATTKELADASIKNIRWKEDE